MSRLSEKISLALNNKRKKSLESDITRRPNFCTKLRKDFFQAPCTTLAKSLLGKLLVRKCDNNMVLKGRIVETECYLGHEDKASHSFNGRRTARNEPMYMEPGTAYVYIIYGMYHCFNISSLEAGGAVLIRALEPVMGTDEMLKFRTARNSKPVKIQDVCKGPANLCISMKISKEVCNKIDLTDNSLLWLENDPNFVNINIIETARVGISSHAEEWMYTPLRFYIKGNTSVSKRDRIKEKELPII